MKRQALDELRDSAPSATADAAGAGHDVHTNADDAEAGQEEDLRFAEIQIDRERLEGIEHAQQRLLQGSYGVCLDCGEEIPRERLFAQPTAIRCTACQVAFEGRED